MKILNFASLLSLQNPVLAEGFKSAEILSVSPLQDPHLPGELIKCEIGAQSFVLALICSSFCDEQYFADLDAEYLSGESSVGEEEIEQISASTKLCAPISHFISSPGRCGSCSGDTLKISALLKPSASAGFCRLNSDAKFKIFILSPFWRRPSNRLGYSGSSLKAWNLALPPDRRSFEPR